MTFIVKAKTGGQGLVFAFVSLAHLYSFCMMLSIHSHDTSPGPLLLIAAFLTGVATAGIAQ